MAMSVMAGRASVVLNSTNFPDATFRAYVSEITGVAEGGTISDAQLQAVTRISIWSSNIKSLKGVEYFTALTALVCDLNQLTSLDVSHNTALTELCCQNNQLTSLDVSHNTALTSLHCYNNPLTYLDVSHNTALTELDCGYNKLTILDVSHNTALTALYCRGNELVNLDVSHNTALTELSCSNNQLTNLDVSHNTELTTLWCFGNQLTSLDVSYNTVLAELYCNGNLLTSLDVSHNIALTHLECPLNQLTSLDVSHNTALNYLACRGNQLMCLDLSKCTKLTSTSVFGQVKSMVASFFGLNQYSIDVPTDFDISKVSSFKVNSTSVTPTMANGQLVFTSSTPTNIYYEYDTSNSIAGMMDVSVSITDIIGETTYYDLTISASGNGSASYSGTSIRNKSQTFSVVEGTNATITFTPDTGYRIKSVKKNGTDVTSSVSNNKYTVSVTANTTIAVVFEEIPPTYYDLTISASGNGSATYSGTSIRNKSQTFSVVEGTNATITFTPDTGYRIKSVKKNGTNVTSSVTNNQYTVSNISANTTVAVVFEQKPPTYHNFSLTASGNGTADYGGTSVRNSTSIFSLLEGTDATVTFTPDAGNVISMVKLNGINVTPYVTNNQYTVTSISANTTLTVEFEQQAPIYHDLTLTATGNGSASYNGTTVRGKSQTFSVEEGANATITFTPDTGYRIKSVKKNGTDVTSSVTNNQYTVSITSNTTVAVVFEQIPATTYDLTVSATGNGSATYNGTTVRGKSQTFTVNEGTNATITFTPDEGYRIKSVKKNGTDVTSSVSDNKYTVSITSNTTVAVVFEQIPATTYDLTITATGNGSATYNGTTVRGKSQTFTVNEGMNATITFTPDTGYRIKSVKKNNTDVTSSVSDNKLTVSNITANTTIAVVFEEIPAATYELTITASGGGQAVYTRATVRDKSQTFTVSEGADATITFTPDAGCQIASVKKDGTNVTSSLTDNKLTLSNITSNTTVAVVFEPIPEKTYDLGITATGNGAATYDGTAVRDKTQTFTVAEGATATITFAADEGHQLASVKQDGTDVTSSVSDNSLTLTNITSNTTIAVSFEPIPVATYTLTLKVSGNGSASYDGTAVRATSKKFTVDEGTNAVITFAADAGNKLGSVKVGSTNVTSKVKNNQYTVSNIKANKTVTVVFEEEVFDDFTVAGISYHVSSAALRTVEVTGCSTEHAVIPESVAQYEDTWKVTAIAEGAFIESRQLVSVSVPASMETVADGLFSACPRLCAVTWHADVPLTAAVLGTVTNPNLLVYVDSQEQTTLSVPNIIVNGMAEEITLTEASDGNDFYCPETFSARQVSYVRHFGMTTGIGECRGWESIVLPFSVQKFYHATRGELIPFAAWDGMHGKPFWLLDYGADGFTETGSLEANVPYIISMPNNPKYASDYNLAGDITFSARNAVVKATTEMASVTGNGKTFVPSYAHEENTTDAFILNVNGSFVHYGGAYPEGSVFIRNLRDIRPFEAYFTNVQQAKEVLPVFDDETTPIHSIPVDAMLQPRVTVYSVTGQLMKSEKNISIEEVLQGLVRGVYIVNGKKYAVYEKGMEE